MSCVSFLPHQLSLLVLLLTQTRNEFEPPGPVNGKCWRLTTQSYFIKEKQGQVYLATAIAYWLACWAAMAFTCLSWEGDIWVQDGCQQCMTELRFHELKKKKDFMNNWVFRMPQIYLVYLDCLVLYVYIAYLEHLASSWSNYSFLFIFIHMCCTYYIRLTCPIGFQLLCMV